MALLGPSSPRRGVGFVLYNIDAVGGMERQARRLAERLATRGVPVTIFSAFFTPERGLTERPLREVTRGVEIVRVPMFNLYMTTEACEVGFEVATLLGCLLRPWIGTLYGIQYTGAYHASRVAAAAGLRATCKFACSGPHGDITTIRQHRRAPELIAALGQLDRLVCLTEHVRREAVDVGLPPERLATIPNGIDVGRFAREVAPAPLAELGPPDGRKVILFTGRLEDQKRVSVLLDALAGLRERVPGARLAVAGVGSRAPDLAEQARALGLGDAVAFLGARDDIEALHRAASVFVLPSESEGLSNALLEALACGTPVIATDIPGNREVVRHDLEALLVPLDDAPALGLALERILTESGLAERLRRAGRERALAEYDLDRIAARYAALFEELGARPAVPRLARFAGPLVVTAAHSIVASALVVARGAVSSCVLAIKRLLGVEAELMSSLEAALRGDDR